MLLKSIQLFISHYMQTHRQHIAYRHIFAVFSCKSALKDDLYDTKISFHWIDLLLLYLFYFMLTVNISTLLLV
jgi:hypothetical protein